MIEIDDEKAMQPAKQGDVAMLAMHLRHVIAMCRAINAKLPAKDEDTIWVREGLVATDQRLENLAQKLMFKDAPEQ